MCGQCLADWDGLCLKFGCLNVRAARISWRMRYVISSLLTSQQRRVAYERFPDRTKLKSSEAAGRDGLTSPRPEHDSGRCSAPLPAVCVWYLSPRRQKRHGGDRTPQACREAELCAASGKQTDLEDSFSRRVFTPQGLEVETRREILANFANTEIRTWLKVRAPNDVVPCLSIYTLELFHIFTLSNHKLQTSTNWGRIVKGKQKMRVTAVNMLYLHRWMDE